MNYGHHLRFTVMVPAPSTLTSVISATQDLAEKLKALYEQLVESIKSVQDT